MNIGKIRDQDIGRWFLTDDGRAVQLVRLYGPLLLMQTCGGRWYMPVHDIQRRLSDEEALQMTGGRKPKSEVKERKKRKFTPTHRIVRTDGEGNEDVFRTIKEAAEASNVSHSTVSNVCRGRIASCKGYSFRYENI